MVGAGMVDGGRSTVDGVQCTVEDGWSVDGGRGRWTVDGRR